MVALLSLDSVILPNWKAAVALGARGNSLFSIDQVSSSGPKLWPGSSCYPKLGSGTTATLRAPAFDSSPRR